jgi:SAM-dependent methyltransferase
MTIPCKICAEPAHDVGVVNFNKNCPGLALNPKIDTIVGNVCYFQCQSCGFLFTPDFDSWTKADFRQRIYNEGYDIVDPDYVNGSRAVYNALEVMQKIPLTAPCLDYGSGKGELTQTLREHGYTNVHAYDPLYRDWPLPSRWQASFDFITCFEVLEHSPVPRQTVADIAILLSPSGTVFFSTHTLGEEFAREGLGWWYIGPRNGHISIFSQAALYRVWNDIGFDVVSINPNRHSAQRKES